MVTYIKHSIALFILVLFTTLPTYAAEVVDPAALEGLTAIDFSKLASGTEPFVFFVLGFIALWGYKWVSDKFGIKPLTDAEYNALIQPLLKEATAYGVGKLEDADWLKLETKNEAVAVAVNYAMDHGSVLLDKAGMSQEQLIQKLEAKLIEEGYDTSPGKWDASKE